jgi:hypothetical protein
MHGRAAARKAVFRNRSVVFKKFIVAEIGILIIPVYELTPWLTFGCGTRSNETS